VVHWWIVKRNLESCFAGQQEGLPERAQVREAVVAAAVEVMISRTFWSSSTGVTGYQLLNYSATKTECDQVYHSAGPINMPPAQIFRRQDQDNAANPVSK
jgi:hypothetical protein